MNSESSKPTNVGSNDLLGLVDAVGMVNYLNHGAASHVSSEGCHGVTQEHLERFVELVRAAERERCAQVSRDLWNEQEAAHGNRAGEYHNGLTAGLDLAERRIRLGA